MTQNKQDLISAVKEHHVRKDFAYDAKVIEKNVNKLAQYVEEDHKRKYASLPINVTIKRGNKYWKVITDNSVHCFVDILNGNVYKPASWNKPAAIPRYNLLVNAQDCFNNVDSNGGYLYIR
tara:strand:- start:216 stop:578 length:363 start_codon:yes stop_codon:yes gene_type:complete